MAKNFKNTVGKSGIAGLLSPTNAKQPVSTHDQVQDLQDEEEKDTEENVSIKLPSKLFKQIKQYLVEEEPMIDGKKLRIKYFFAEASKEYLKNHAKNSDLK